jgi:hypothetical protein
MRPRLHNLVYRFAKYLPLSAWHEGNLP